MIYQTIFRTAFLFASLALVSPPITNAQTAPVILWQHCYGGDSTDAVNCVNTTPDGGLIATGYTHSTNGDLSGNGGVTGLWVLKTDAAGNIQWEKTYNDTLCSGSHVETTYDGGYILTGSHTVKLYGNGSIQWVANYQGNTIHQTADSGYVLCNNIAPFITHLHPDGSLDWQQIYGPATTIVGISDVWQSFTSGYVIGGESYDIHPEPFYGRTDGAGSLTLPISSIIAHSSGGPLCKTNDGNYLFVDDLVQGGFNVTKFDDGLITKWQAGPFRSSATGIAATADYGFATWGGSNIDSAENMTLIKFDSAHNQSWSISLAGTSSDNTANVTQTPDGNYAVASTISITDLVTPGKHGGSDGWIAKIGYPEGVHPVAPGPASITVYPVPATGQLTVSLPTDQENATLRLTDVSGNVLLTDNSKGLSRTLDLSHFAAGEYVLSVIGKQSVQAIKVVHY